MVTCNISDGIHGNIGTIYYGYILKIVALWLDLKGIEIQGTYSVSTWFSTYSWIDSTPHSVPVCTSCT